MTATVITASVLVQFEDGDADHLSASLDERVEGFNAGRSSFLRGAAGDEGRPAFLVWSSIGHPAAPASARGELQVEAAGGSLTVLAAEPTVSTQHEQDVTEMLDVGTGSITVSLSPPAATLPVFASEYGHSVVVSAPNRLRDGSIGSVQLTRSSTASRAWVLGKLTWTGRARAYRIAPATGATRVVLLATAKV